MCLASYNLIKPPGDHHFYTFKLNSYKLKILKFLLISDLTTVYELSESNQPTKDKSIFERNK